MARSLAHVINILDPDVIVLGGGMSNIDRLYASVPRLWGPFQLLLNARTDLIKAFAEESLFGRIETADAGAGRAASYLWLGGVRAGTVWHGPRPRCATPWLIARLGSDVYFRPDTLGLFVHELVRIRP